MTEQLLKTSGALLQLCAAKICGDSVVRLVRMLDL